VVSGATEEAEEDPKTYGRVPFYDRVTILRSRMLENSQCVYVDCTLVPCKM